MVSILGNAFLFVFFTPWYGFDQFPRLSLKGTYCLFYIIISFLVLLLCRHLHFEFFFYSLFQNIMQPGNISTLDIGLNRIIGKRKQLFVVVSVMGQLNYVLPA